MNKISSIKQMRKRRKLFPWLKVFCSKYATNFFRNEEFEAFDYLLQNVENELKNIEQHSEKAQDLFDMLNSLFLNFWWRIRWKDSKSWNTYWKKVEVVNTPINDVQRKYCTKLLYCLLYISIILTEGNQASQWIDRILTTIKLLPVGLDVPYDALLLIKNLKKRYCIVYSLILKYVLCKECIDSVSSPNIYSKIILLFRRLLKFSRDKKEKTVILHSAARLKPPSNIIHWFSLLNVGIEDLKCETLTLQLLFRPYPDELLRKLTTTLVKEFTYSENLQDDTIDETNIENMSFYDLSEKNSFYQENLRTKVVEEPSQFFKEIKQQNEINYLVTERSLEDVSVKSVTEPVIRDKNLKNKIRNSLDFNKETKCDSYFMSSEELPKKRTHKNCDNEKKLNSKRKKESTLKPEIQNFMELNAHRMVKVKQSETSFEKNSINEGAIPINNSDVLFRINAIKLDDVNQSCEKGESTKFEFFDNNFLDQNIKEEKQKCSKSSAKKTYNKNKKKNKKVCSKETPTKSTDFYMSEDFKVFLNELERDMDPNSGFCHDAKKSIEVKENDDFCIEIETSNSLTNSKINDLEMFSNQVDESLTPIDDEQHDIGEKVCTTKFETVNDALMGKRCKEEKHIDAMNLKKIQKKETRKNHSKSKQQSKELKEFSDIVVKIVNAENFLGPDDLISIINQNSKLAKRKLLQKETQFLDKTLVDKNHEVDIDDALVKENLKSSNKAEKKLKRRAKKLYNIETDNNKDVQNVAQNYELKSLQLNHNLSLIGNAKNKQVSKKGVDFSTMHKKLNNSNSKIISSDNNAKLLCSRSSESNITLCEETAPTSNSVSDLLKLPKVKIYRHNKALGIENNKHGSSKHNKQNLCVFKDNTCDKFQSSVQSNKIELTSDYQQSNKASELPSRNILDHTNAMNYCSSPSLFEDESSFSQPESVNHAFAQEVSPSGNIKDNTQQLPNNYKNTFHQTASANVSSDDNSNNSFILNADSLTSSKQRSEMHAFSAILDHKEVKILTKPSSPNNSSKCNLEPDLTSNVEMNSDSEVREFGSQIYSKNLPFVVLEDIKKSCSETSSMELDLHSSVSSSTILLELQNSPRASSFHSDLHSSDSPHCRKHDIQSSYHVKSPEVGEISETEKNNFSDLNCETSAIQHSLNVKTDSNGNQVELSQHSSRECINNAESYNVSQELLQKTSGPCQNVIDFSSHSEELQSFASQSINQANDINLEEKYPSKVMSICSESANTENDLFTINPLNSTMIDIHEWPKNIAENNLYKNVYSTPYSNSQPNCAVDFKIDGNETNQPDLSSISSIQVIVNLNDKSNSSAASTNQLITTLNFQSNSFAGPTNVFVNHSNPSSAIHQTSNSTISIPPNMFCQSSPSSLLLPSSVKGKQNTNSLNEDNILSNDKNKIHSNLNNSRLFLQTEDVNPANISKGHNIVKPEANYNINASPKMATNEVPSSTVNCLTTENITFKKDLCSPERFKSQYSQTYFHKHVNGHSTDLLNGYSNKSKDHNESNTSPQISKNKLRPTRLTYSPETISTSMKTDRYSDSSRYRTNSDVYSDVSSDDLSISTLSLISDIETELSVGENLEIALNKNSECLTISKNEKCQSLPSYKMLQKSNEYKPSSKNWTTLKAVKIGKNKNPHTNSENDSGVSVVSQNENSAVTNAKQSQLLNADIDSPPRNSRYNLRRKSSIRRPKSLYEYV